MSNTYAKIETFDEHEGLPELNIKGYSNNMYLSLTAFVGGKSGKHTQLTVQTISTIEGQSGIGYITLGDKEVDLLIAALMERKLGIISATGYNQSIFCPADEVED